MEQLCPPTAPSPAPESLQGLERDSDGCEFLLYETSVLLSASLVYLWSDPIPVLYPSLPGSRWFL